MVVVVLWYCGGDAAVAGDVIQTHKRTNAPITHHLLAHETRRRLALLTVAGHLFGRLFVRHDVPDAVTRQDHELIRFRALHDRDVRERRHLRQVRVRGRIRMRV